MTSFTESCELPVCWSQPPGSNSWEEVWGCGQYGEPCWYVSPDGSVSELGDCASPICWVPFDGFTFPAPCDVQLCTFTAPDGATTSNGFCFDDVCWAQAPGGGAWQPIYYCSELDPCWFSPPGGGTPILEGCDYLVQFATGFPPGALNSEPQLVYSGDAPCWPAPDSDVPFYTFWIDCDDVEGVYWFTPPGESFALPAFGLAEACWRPMPPATDLPPDFPAMSDLVYPGECEEGEEAKPGIPSVSTPVDMVEGVSSPAETIEGTVEERPPDPSSSQSDAAIVPGQVEYLAPVPSSAAVSAEIVLTGRIEQAPPEAANSPLDPPHGNEPSPSNRPTTLPELLGFQSEPQVEALPDSGGGPGRDVPYVTVAGALLAVGLACAGAARVRHRR
jgi:hypothetical protein